MPAIGPTELIILLLLALILFGAGKLSEVGGAMGKSIREFRKASNEEDGKPKPVVDPSVQPPAPSA